MSQQSLSAWWRYLLIISIGIFLFIYLSTVDMQKMAITRTLIVNNPILIPRLPNVNNTMVIPEPPNGNNTMVIPRPLNVNSTTEFGSKTYVQRFVNNEIVYDNLTWKTPAMFNITCISNATILYPHGLVFNKFKPFSFGKWYWRKDEGKIHRVQNVLSYPKHAFSLVQIWDNNFQHITFDTIPRVALSCKWLQQRPLIIIIILNNLQGDLIREFCPLEQDRFRILNRTTSFSSICVPYFDQNFQMGIVPPGSMTSLGSQTKVGTDVVYIARKRGRSRSVLNEEEVLLTIREILSNVTVVYPTGNWRENRKLFENARVIIGPHGGAFGNIIFAPTRTIVIEFTPLKSLRLRKQNERPCYFGLSHALGFTYYSVEPKIFNYEKPMTMDITKLKNVLQKVVESRSA